MRNPKETQSGKEKCEEEPVRGSSLKILTDRQISHPTFSPNVSSVSFLMITTTLYFLSDMSLRTESPKYCLVLKKVSGFLQCLFCPAFPIFHF